MRSLNALSQRAMEIAKQRGEPSASWIGILHRLSSSTASVEGEALFSSSPYFKSALASNFLGSMKDFTSQL